MSGLWIPAFKILWVILSLVLAIAASRPEGIPADVRRSKVAHYASLFVVYAFAGLAFLVLLQEVRNWFVEEPIEQPSSRDIGLEPSNALPSVAKPDIRPIPPPRGLEGQKSFSIAGIGIGDKTDQAVSKIVGRWPECNRLPTRDEKDGPLIYKRDPVFQSSILLECFRSQRSFDYFVIFPDIYETGERVFAIARISKLAGLDKDDVFDLLVSRYGRPDEPGFQPNSGAFFRWHGAPGPISEADHRGCFLYLPRALEPKFDFITGPIDHSEDVLLHLNSHEIDQDCQTVMGAYWRETSDLLYLFLADTRRVLDYRRFHNELEAAEEVERRNAARKEIDF